MMSTAPETSIAPPPAGRFSDAGYRDMGMTSWLEKAEAELKD